MNESDFRPMHVAAAAVLIGGLLAALIPAHGVNIVRLVLVTIAAGAGIWALVAFVPRLGGSKWWLSPFDRRDRARRDRDRDAPSRELDRVASRFEGRRRPVPWGPPLPPGTVRHLAPMIRAALEREGLDPWAEADADEIQARLLPLTRGVLEAQGLERPSWFRMRRSDPRKVARAVTRVLDDLERLDRTRGGAPAADPEPPPHLQPPRTQ